MDQMNLLAEDPETGYIRPNPNPDNDFELFKKSFVDRPAIGKFQRPGDAAETQRTAAVLAYPSTGTWRRRVLDEIALAGEYGRTDEEIQVLLGMNPSTQRPRRVELVEGGWIVDSGRRRKTRSGREAVVWVVDTWRPNGCPEC